MAVGFWDTFFDNDYRQRSDINDMRDETAYASAEIAGVRQHAVRLQRQVSDLSVLVSVLVRMLEESGHLDAKVLRYRVEAELENLAVARGERVYAEPPPPAHIVNPPEPQAPTTPTTCSKCGQTVPANRTTITESGIVCDGCVAGR